MASSKGTLAIGKAAPAFSLSNQVGKIETLKNVSANYTVVYFYPKDDTPGCTIEAKGFSSMVPAFKKAGAQIFGISGGDKTSKAKFCKKYDLRLQLLADEDFSVSKKYGAFGKKSFMGRNYQGILRKTFVLDKNKRVLKVYDSVKPDGHAEEVLEFISAASSRQVLLPLTRASVTKKSKAKAKMAPKKKRTSTKRPTKRR